MCRRTTLLPFSGAETKQKTGGITRQASTSETSGLSLKFSASQPRDRTLHVLPELRREEWKDELVCRFLMLRSPINYKRKFNCCIGQAVQDARLLSPHSGGAWRDPEKSPVIRISTAADGSASPETPL